MPDVMVDEIEYVRVRTAQKPEGRLARLRAGRTIRRAERARPVRLTRREREWLQSLLHDASNDLSRDLGWTSLVMTGILDKLRDA